MTEGKKPGLIKRHFARLGRISRNASGIDAIRQQGDLIRSETSSLWSRFKDAILRPSRWSSIEELEYAWGIDDGNRSLVIRSLRVEIALFALFTMMGVWQVLRWLDGASIMGALLPGLLLVLLGLTKGVIAAWRLDVLVRRLPVNFIQWMGVRR